MFENYKSIPALASISQVFSTETATENKTAGDGAYLSCFEMNQESQRDLNPPNFHIFYF